MNKRKGQDKQERAKAFFLTVTPMPGFGLISMKDRAEASKGLFHVESTMGKGTVVRVSWPSV